MPFRLSCLLLVVCLMWSGLVLSRPATDATDLPMPIGMAVTAGLGDDDGAPHAVDSLASTAPADAGAELVALLPQATLEMLPLPAAPPPSAGSPSLPKPYLEAPRRPPRA